MKDELAKQLTNKELLAILKKTKKQSNYVAMFSLVIIIALFVVYLLNIDNIKNNATMKFILGGSSGFLFCLLSAYSLYITMYLGKITGEQCKNITKNKLIVISNIYEKIATQCTFGFTVLFVLTKSFI